MSSNSNLPTLVILPGWGGSHETWANFLGLAGKEINVVCIDLPCFGGEPCPKNVWGIEEYSKFAVEKLKKIEGDKVLLGHSFGGQVATRVAIDNPNLLKGLILSGAALVRPKKLIRRILFGSIAKFGKLIFRLPIIESFSVLAKKIFYKSIDSPDYTKTSGIQRDIYRKIIRQDLTKELHKLDLPVFVTWGQKDKMTPLRYGKKINTLLKGANFKVFPNGNHGLHRQQTDNYFKAILDFIKSLN